VHHAALPAGVEMRYAALQPVTKKLGQDIAFEPENPDAPAGTTIQYAQFTSADNIRVSDYDYLSWFVPMMQALPGAPQKYKLQAGQFAIYAQGGCNMQVVVVYGNTTRGRKTHDLHSNLDLTFDKGDSVCFSWYRLFDDDNLNETNV